MAKDEELIPEAGRSASWWRWVRISIGYAAFVAAVVYGLKNAPAAAWRIDPGWLALAAIAMGASIFFQVVQAVIFLRCHDVSGEWFAAFLFTLRKTVLNVLLPARSGTLLVLQTLTRRCPVKWYQYVHFSLVASIASLGVSMLAAGFVWLGWRQGLVLSIAGVVATMGVARYARLRYLDRMVGLLLVATGMYLSFLMGFWCLINGLGWNLNLGQAAVFAILMNLLALVSITPGNLGVREAMLGAAAPMLSVPVSVGILVGACVYVLRLLVGAALLLAFEWTEARRTALASTQD
ncbi:MAG TPA: hypothetical protein VLS27_14290 [Gammaproteobacteria bacterium]|nr:hypothetical protein [Gammaproteobacteria bacterium]